MISLSWMWFFGPTRTFDVCCVHTWSTITTPVLIKAWHSKVPFRELAQRPVGQSDAETGWAAFFTIITAMLPSQIVYG